MSYIEKKLGEAGMVFQLPYFKFPEAGYVGSISDYQLIKGYLHSKKIKWSYGAYKGKKEDLWNRQISSLSLPEILEKISITGFNGIYIDKRGYSSEDYQKLEEEIILISGSQPYFSDDKNLVFFDIREYSNLIKSKYSENGSLEAQKDKILNEFISTEGIYSEELLGENIKDSDFTEKTWYYKQEHGQEFKIEVADFKVSYKENELKVDFGTSGYGRNNRKYKLEIKNVEIVFDSSSIELFANDGSFALSTRFYPENHNVKISANNYIAQKLGEIEIREEN